MRGEYNKPVIIAELIQANLRSVFDVKALLHDQVISISTDVAIACRIMHLMQPDPIIHQVVSSKNMHAFRAT